MTTLDVQPNEDLLSGVHKKALFKQSVYKQTKETFSVFKDTLQKIESEYRQRFQNETRIDFSYKERNEFEAELTFGSDVLVFIMHTNIFEFSRDHEVMKTNYIHNKPENSYCGVIMIYNFLADSFKYNRINDLGYMIGRVFVNNEKHYFIEGKKEIGQLYNNFETSIISPESVREICESAVRYTVNFDLLTPPYEAMKTITIEDVQIAVESMNLVTGKRLGFRFQADTDK